jgi:sulfite reductase (NADPH) flavoprotein alpha-component
MNRADLLTNRVEFEGDLADGMAATRSVKSVCPYCGVGCGIVMEVADGRITRITGDKTHPANFGRLCTKGSSAHLPVSAMGRADKAYARLGDSYDQAPLPIDDAIRLAANGLRTIIDRDGPDAVCLYVSGQMSLEAQYLANKLCKGFIGTNNIESNSRLCMASAASGYKLSLGADGPPGSYQDFDKADLFFVIGANMADCHPILFLRMMDRVKAGARLIVVDPRRTATADKADLFLQIKPGTDLALLNGLLHLLVEAGRVDQAFIDNFTEGWADMPGFLADYAPARVAGITGLAEADLHRAADLIGNAAEWMTCWTMGLNQSTHGTWNTNAICNLHLATGAICRPGSGPFSLTGQPNAMGGREMGYMGPGLPGQRTTASAADRAFVEAAWKVPAGTLRAEAGSGTVGMFEDMAAGKIKACWIICTNPVASLANRQTAIAALEAAELVIAQDVFLDTETNRYADIVLPGALWAEAEGVMVNSERNLTLMRKAVEPPGEAMADWQIIARVAREMGYGEAFSHASAAEVFEEIKQFWNPGTGYDLRGADHARLAETPLQWPCPPASANDRNPVRYRNTDASQSLGVSDDGGQPAIVFPTERGKAFFLARPHVEPAEMPDPEYPFVLNTGRLQHQWHTLTKTGKVPTLNKLNPGPFVEIHPEDAEALGIGERDQVEIRSRRGRAVLPAAVTDRVRPGNCFAPFHWNDVFGDDLAINAVTSDAVDPISRQPEFKYSAIALSRISGPLVAGPAETTPQAAAHPAEAVALARLLGLSLAESPRFTPSEQGYLAGFIGALATPEALERQGVPLLPPSAPFEPAHLHFVNGMLAGLYSRAPGGSAAPLPISAETRSPQKDILVLWASQTGNAEEFASRCRDELAASGHTVRLSSLAEVRPAELAEVHAAFFVVSTFGDGDPPDNGGSFWDSLLGEDAPRLDDLNYAILAFGDSSYGQFCGFGRRLDARLGVLGGRRMVDRVDCEPDYEEAANAWLANIGNALSASTRPAAAGKAEASAPPEASPYSRKSPFTSRLVVNRVLSGAGSQKEVRQLGFDLSGSGLTYAAGDALGIWPVNCPDLVSEILDIAAIAPDTAVAIKGAGEMPIGEALLRHREIGRLTRSVLESLARLAPGMASAALLEAGRQPDLEKWLWGRQVPDALLEMPAKPDAQTLVDLLKPIQPRLYSISSSPKTSPDEVQLTVSVLRYGDRRRRKGMCSTYLADRALAEAPRLFIQPSAHFHPPADPLAPMIMIGPGTGIAPFRGFLHDRLAAGATGRNWLFFGEQHAASDFYYRDELQAWLQGGHLTRLDLAFSRDTAEKVYVQHRMLQNGAELWRWLEEGASVFVCGDAARMAKDVDAALRAIVAEQGNMGYGAATDYVAALWEKKRYVRDVY